MSWTYSQKMAATAVALQSYRNGLPPGDPEIPTIDTHLQYRTDLNNYGNDVKNASKLGPGSNPPGNPPPPPGS